MLSYTYMINHAPRMRVRASLNGIPFYRCSELRSTNLTHVNGACHMLLPGENTFTYAILEAPDEGSAIFEVDLDYDDRNPVYKYVLRPADSFPYVIPPRPLVHEGVFFVKDHPFTPSYMRAPKAEFGLEGTPALRDAVRAFHGAMARGDAGAVVSMIAPKIADMQAAYDGHPDMTEAAAARAFGEQFASGVQAAPLDEDRLVFESCVEGRVAYVTRDDGKAPIDVRSGSGDSWSDDLWLTKHEGTWKFFR